MKLPILAQPDNEPLTRSRAVTAPPPYQPVEADPADTFMAEQMALYLESLE